MENKLYRWVKTSKETFPEECGEFHFRIAETKNPITAGIAYSTAVIKEKYHLVEMLEEYTPPPVPADINEEAEAYAERVNPFVWPKNKRGEEIEQRVGQKNPPNSAKHRRENEKLVAAYIAGATRTPIGDKKQGEGDIEKMAQAWAKSQGILSGSPFRYSVEGYIAGRASQPQRDEGKLVEAELEVMIKAFDDIRKLFELRRWIMEGRGSYRYDDDRYKEEVRYLYDDFDKLQKEVWGNIKSKSVDFRKKVIADYLASQPPIAASIVQKLREANPYSGDKEYNDMMIWKQCCYTLESLLKETNP